MEPPTSVLMEVSAIFSVKSISRYFFREIDCNGLTEVLHTYVFFLFRISNILFTLFAIYNLSSLHVLGIPAAEEEGEEGGEEDAAAAEEEAPAEEEARRRRNMRLGRAR